MWRYALAAAFCTWLSGAALAQPQPGCMPYGEARTLLDRAHGEREVLRATTTQPGVSIEILANPNTGTWTLLAVNRPADLACFIAAGEGFYGT